VNGQTPYEPVGDVTADRTRPSDTVQFVAVVRFGRRDADQCGSLELTASRLTFHGTLDVGIAWSEVARVEEERGEIVVHLRGCGRPLRFLCQSADDARRGAAIASRFAAGRSESSPPEIPVL
jgi:hypothetical protein